jgi:hypothetical protein
MTIDCELTPSAQITYVALRAAFVTTLDCLLRYSLDPQSNCLCSHELFGCFPTLHGTAPQMQLEGLFRTWHRWNQSDVQEPDLLDELVLYAAFEALARIASDSRNKSLRVVMNGPHATYAKSEQWLTSQARTLLICPSSPPRHSLLREVSQLSQNTQKFRPESPEEPDAAKQELLGLVGRWVAQREVVLGSRGLLTQDEQDLLRAFFEEHPGLVR